MSESTSRKLKKPSLATILHNKSDSTSEETLTETLATCVEDDKGVEADEDEGISQSQVSESLAPKEDKQEEASQSCSQASSRPQQTPSTPKTGEKKGGSVETQAQKSTPPKTPSTPVALGCLEFKKRRPTSLRCSRQPSVESKVNSTPAPPPPPPTEETKCESPGVTATQEVNSNASASVPPSATSSVSIKKQSSSPFTNIKITSASSSTTSIVSSKAGRSIEIFFGDFTNFKNFYQILFHDEQDQLNNNVVSTKSSSDTTFKKPRTKSKQAKKTPSKDKLGKNQTMNPLAVKKLCLIGHPLESFQGINNFKRLLEAWVTNCTITELKREDFQGLQFLQRLYAFGCSLESVDPLELDNLKILWLSGNRLTNLKFLSHGLPSLQELNVANNEISCVPAEYVFKCVSLNSLNIAGNPLCTIQDIKDVNACSKLKELILVDAMYGKCPVACLCDSRAMIVGTVKNVSILNGKKVTEEEVQVTQEYVKHRCLYYYSNSVAAKANYVALRNATIASVYKQLEGIGERIMDLLAFIAQTEYNLSNVPAFGMNKLTVKEEMQKVVRRITDLRMWAVVTIERFETVIHINRWEQEVEEWVKWVEFQSYGSIQGYIAHSILDLTVSKDVESIRATIHQLISGLSCSKPWPEDVILKVETIVVIRDKGAELGIEKTYNTYFSRTNEPKFIPPPPEPPPTTEPTTTTTPLTPLQALSGHPYQPYRYVPTYTDPAYKPPDPLFPFPESVPGLPERSHPCFLFLVCDRQVECNPVLYLYKLLTDKSENYTNVRFTNCLWNAIEATKLGESCSQCTDISVSSARSSARCQKSNDIGANPFSIVVVMKVLEECLIAVPMPNDKCRKHNFDCVVFGVSRPLSYAPAYLISISHNHNDKNSIWVKGVKDDSSVKAGVDSLYRESVAKQAVVTAAEPATKPQQRKVQPFYLHKYGHGMKADLTSISKIVTTPSVTQTQIDDNSNEKAMLDNDMKGLNKPKSNVDLLRISKFIGPDIAHTVTTLDLSGNGLRLTVGLKGMINLRRLNLSHNNLTTLSGLHKLPHLIELKASWNYLRFLHSSISTLTWATPRLTTLEVLPNPFQDVRDYAHIPLLVSQALPALQRVDIWCAPFATSPTMSHNCFLSTSDIDIESRFSHAILGHSWVQGRTLNYTELKGQSLTNLDQLPRSPPFPDGYTINAIELDLSDNYLSSTALCVASFVRTSEWRASVVKLNLQENCITSLDWLRDNIFPNLHILNLSNNHLQELDMIQYACPALIHLHLSGNPLPCSTFILAPLRHLTNLQNLEATRTPLSSHPDYANYVIRYIPKIQILDGTPVSNWRNEEIVNHMGGSLNTEWMELNLGQRDWSSLTELSLPHCGLSKVKLPPAAVPKLMSLDLTGNQLSSFSGITSLPNLRVLCVSYNSIKSLGPYPCPSCYSHTAESRAQFQKNKRMTGGDLNNVIANGLAGGSRYDARAKLGQSQSKKAVAQAAVKTDSTTNKSNSTDKAGPATNSPRPGAPTDSNTSNEIPKIFPRLEVLIMSHNSLSGVSDLHLHCLPRLQTLMLNCNQITSFKGLDKLSSVQAIVLDHNQIKDVPFNTFVGCKCLKYLHLEHNRIACLPRLPHLNNLAALHLGYNRIQSLTDIHCLTTNGIRELTLAGNPAAYRGDYCRQIINHVETLQKLDGTDVTTLKGDLSELKFTVCENSHSRKSKNKASVMHVPHGNLRYRLNDFKNELHEESYIDDTNAE